MSDVPGQAAFIEPPIYERCDGADHAEGGAVQRMVAHHQPADVAAGAAVDLSASVAGAVPGTFSGELLDRVRGGVGHSRIIAGWLVPAPRKLKRSTGNPKLFNDFIAWKTTLLCIVPPNKGCGWATRAAYWASEEPRLSSASNLPAGPARSIDWIFA